MEQRGGRRARRDRSVGLKNRCSSSAGGRGVGATPVPRRSPASPLRLRPLRPANFFLPTGPSGERRPRSAPVGGAVGAGTERRAGRAEAGGSRAGQGAGFSRPPLPLPTRPPPASFPPSLFPSLSSRIKVGTVALRGWVRANACAAGSLCSVPRSPGARAPARQGGMLLRELLGLLRCCWPSLLLHCALHPLWGSVQVGPRSGGRERRAEPRAAPRRRRAVVPGRGNPWLCRARHGTARAAGRAGEGAAGPASSPGSAQLAAAGARRSGVS